MKTILEFAGKQIILETVGTVENKFRYAMHLRNDPSNPRSIILSQDQVDMLELVSLLLSETNA